MSTVYGLLSTDLGLSLSLSQQPIALVLNKSFNNIPFFCIYLDEINS